MNRLARAFKRLVSPLIDIPPATARKKRRSWSIGIYVGESPFDLASPKCVTNPVLTGENVTDVPAAYTADPFMVRVHQTWYMFFEIMHQRTGKGEIGLATSEDGAKWTYQQVVLEEPFHLSYPYVFNVEDEYYMLPESHWQSSVRLYRAVDFPTRWTYVRILIEGREYVDPSIFHYNDQWWLFVGIGDPPWRADSLCLFYADELTGPWREHPKSPLIEGNRRIARPAGRVLTLDDRVIRYAQDCSQAYGTQVRAFEITELATTRYSERVRESPVLTGTGAGWNGGGMHHVDLHPLDDGRWIACVDGWVSIEA